MSLEESIRKFGFRGVRNLAIFGEDKEKIIKFIETEGRSDEISFIDQDLQIFLGSHPISENVLFVYNKLRECGYDLIAHSFLEYILFDHDRMPETYSSFGKLSLTNRTRIRRVAKKLERIIKEIDNDRRIECFFEELESGCVTPTLLKESFISESTLSKEEQLINGLNGKKSTDPYKKDYEWFRSILNFLWDKKFLKRELLSSLEISSFGVQTSLYYLHTAPKTALLDTLRNLKIKSDARSGAKKRTTKKKKDDKKKDEPKPIGPVCPRCRQPLEPGEVIDSRRPYCNVCFNKMIKGD